MLEEEQRYAEILSNLTTEPITDVLARARRFSRKSVPHRTSVEIMKSTIDGIVGVEQVKSQRDDLLAALEEIERRASSDWPYPHDVLKKVSSIARAVIAKAKGDA